LTVGVDFINILRASSALGDPKSEKGTFDLMAFFAHVKPRRKRETLGQFYRVSIYS